MIVVEHDEETIRAADHILDLGPGAGPRGGEIVAQGTLEEVLRAKNSPTADYLSGRARIAIPQRRRVEPRLQRRPATAGSPWPARRKTISKNVTAAFPIGCFTCVTGVSGSGKSTLVDDILRRALFRHFYNSKDKPGTHKALRGLDQLDKAIVIDQSAIGRTPRSNPITYTGAFTPIRELFSQLPAARVRGYDAGRFSFNVKGGRCENCEGGGLIKIEMHFLPDVYVECEVCRGQRYNRETLEITYKGKNIADVLDLTVDEAARFFRNVPAVSDRLVAHARCRPRISPARPGGHDPLRRRSATGKAGDRAGEKGDGPDDLHPRRADHGTAFCRHRKAAPGADETARCGQYAGRD